MDIFVLPSKFEGIPVVGIEAQISRLKLYVFQIKSHQNQKFQTTLNFIN